MHQMSAAFAGDLYDAVCNRVFAAGIGIVQRFARCIPARRPLTTLATCRFRPDSIDFAPFGSARDTVICSPSPSAACTPHQSSSRKVSSDSWRQESQQSCLSILGWIGHLCHPHVAQGDIRLRGCNIHGRLGPGTALHLRVKLVYHTDVLDCSAAMWCAPHTTGRSQAPPGTPKSCASASWPQGYDLTTASSSAQG